MFGFFNREGKRSKYDPKSLENETNPSPIKGTEEQAPHASEDDIPTESPAPERVLRPKMTGLENTENPLPIDAEAAKDAITSAYEEADTVNQYEELTDKDIEPLDDSDQGAASIGMAYGGSIASEATGQERAQRSEKVVTSLGESEEAQRTMKLVRTKYENKMATSTPEIALMSLEAEMEETEDALAAAQEDQQETIIREMNNKLSALQATKNWLESNGDKKVA